MYSGDSFMSVIRLLMVPRYDDKIVINANLVCCLTNIPTRVCSYFVMKELKILVTRLGVTESIKIYSKKKQYLTECSNGQHLK